MGSENNEQNPSEGSLDGAAENEFCRKAAENGYLTAIVKYRKTLGVADWNGSSVMLIGFGCWSTGNITDEMLNEYQEHHRNPTDEDQSNFIIE